MIDIIFLLIKQTSKPKIESNKRLDIKEVYSSILKENYTLLIINNQILELQEFLIRERIEAQFIYPYLSVSLFNTIYGEQIAKEKELTKIKLPESILENLIACEKNKLPQYNCYFYYIGDLIQKDNYSIENLMMANKALSYNNLLMPISHIKMTLRDLLLFSIEKTISKEKETENLTIIDSKIQNENFFMEGLTNFLLLAIKYYGTEEIKEYLQKEFKELL